MFLLVPAYPGCPGSKAVKRSLLLLISRMIIDRQLTIVQDYKLHDAHNRISARTLYYRDIISHPDIRSHLYFQQNSNLERPTNMLSLLL